MKNLFSIIIQSAAIILMLTLGSCGSVVNADDCENLQVAAETFIDAALLYGQDPSSKNCIAYKEAGEEYLDLARGCSFAFGPGLEDTENEISSLDC